MRKYRRPILIVAVSLVGLLLAAYLGLRAYLHTSSARNLVSDTLAAKLGGDIVVKNINSGLGSTTVEIELPGGSADGSAAPPEPLVTGTVHVDASPIALAAGSMPNTVTVENAQITLHFDKEGNIKDKLPSPKSGGGGGKLPEIKIVGASIHFVQEGKPDFRATGIDVTVTDTGEKLVIAGKGEDPTWGAWTLTGEWGSDGSAGAIDFKSNAPIPFTPTKLRSIPFVPLEVWDVVELEGSSPVHVRVGRKAEKWWWQVDAKPSGSRLNVAAIDLGFTDVSGAISVDGTKVTLRDVTGKTADGVVRASADLDFPPKTSILAFDVAANGLDIKKLPKAWNLPPQFTAGRAVGSAKVKVVITDGKMETTGGGSINLEKAEVLGFPAEKAEIQMYSDGKRLRFGTPPPKVAETKTALPLPDDDAAKLAALLVLLMQAPPAPAAPPAAPKADETTYVQMNLKLRDVDLAEFVSRAKIELPIKLAGKLTIEVAAEIPVNDAGKIRMYRVKGKASLPELQIEGLTLKNLTAEVELRKGVLTLTKLAADVPDTATANGKVGSFLGTAQFAIDPRGDLSADLKITELPLGPILAAVPGLSDVASGTVSGAFTVTAKGDRLSDLSTLKGSGKLTSETLTLFKQKADNVAADITVDKGIVRVSKASVDIYRGTITGSAKYALTGTDPAAVSLAFKDLDTLAATKDIPNLPVKLEGRVSGKLDATLPPVKENEPRVIAGDLLLESPQLKVQGIPAQRLKGAVEYKKDAIHYALKGEALGGSFDLDGSYPLKKPKPAAAIMGPMQSSQLRLTNLRLDKLAEALKIPALGQLRGTLTVLVLFDFDETGPTGRGWIDLTGFGWGNDAASAVSATVRISPQKIELTEIGGGLAAGTIRGQLTYDLDNPRRSNYALHLRGISLETVLKPFGMDHIEGDFDVALRGAIGPEISGSGYVTSSRAVVNGIRIENLRSNVEWAVGTKGAGRIVVRDLAARVAGGRVSGNAILRWSDTAQVEGGVTFTDVYIRGLLAQIGQSTSTVSGRMTGKFLFRGDRVRSVDDVRGTLNGTLGDTQVASLPVFRAITPYVAPLRGAAPFQQGEFQARLGGGKFHFDRLTLASPSVMMFITGDVGLRGHLDLGVVATTGSLAPSPGTLQFLGLRLPTIGPVPVGLVLEVVNYLSNRVIRLNVTGTFDRPTVQVNVLALLSDEAIRFFLNRYFSVNGGVPQPR